MSAVRLDSNAVEMTTAEHCMYLTQFCESLACQSCLDNSILYSLGNLHVCLIIITMTSQIYKSRSLHELNSTRTRTGACITLNQMDWRIEELQVGSQNTVIAQRYR